jgi:transcriptional regulator
MYTTPAFAVDSSTEILGALRRISFGHLVSAVTTGRPGLQSTPLPFVVDDELSELRAHVARANPHWNDLDGLEALMIVAGPDAYISPRWYPSKAEHGRVVPTWNYEVIHLHGTIEIHDDASWKADLVAALTDHNEPRVGDSERPEPWAVSDAPAGFIDAQLRAIVGVRMRITSIEAKRKLSQNKAPADRAGAIAGLDRSPRRDDTDTAALMRATEAS